MSYRKSYNNDRIIWSSVLPHFTKKGLTSFIGHFDQEYFDALGKGFDNAKVGTIVF